MSKKLMTIAITGLLGACSWVDLSEQGKQVFIVDQSYVTNCQKVGNVSAKTRKALIAGSPREADRIANELQILARNEAAKISANTLVAKAAPKNGEQHFNAYYCPR